VNRGFVTLTAVNFQFHDSQSPSQDIVLDSLLGVYGGGNDSGWLTSDGLHLDHNQSINPQVSFWIAAWQYPGIDVGLYSWNSTGDSLEYFEYWNHGVVARTTGTWSLQIIPEPSAICLNLDWLVYRRGA
jgi:hypothetical protein